MTSKNVYEAFQKWRQANRAWLNANHAWTRRWMFYSADRRRNAPELRARNNAARVRANAFANLEAAVARVHIPLYHKWLAMHKRRFAMTAEMSNIHNKINKSNTSNHEKIRLKRLLKNLREEQNKLTREEPELKQALNALTARRLAAPTEAELVTKLGPQLKAWHARAVARPHGIATVNAAARWRRSPITNAQFQEALRRANRAEERIRNLLRQVNRLTGTKRKRASPKRNGSPGH